MKFDCRRPLLFQGPMGTAAMKLAEADGTVLPHRFSQWRDRRLGIPDALNLDDPSIAEALHRGYLEAGADVLVTNTMLSNTPSLRDAGLGEEAERINVRGVEIARAAIRTYAGPDRAGQYSVVASVGPIIPAVEADPELRKRAYRSQIGALVAAGPDALMLETVVSAEGAAEALRQTQEVLGESGSALPVIVSFTPTDGALLPSGEEAAEAARRLCGEFAIDAVGINCVRPAALAVRIAFDMANVTGLPVLVRPSASLAGAGEESPESMAAALRPLVDAGIAAGIGTCCGASTLHTEALRRMLDFGINTDIQPFN